MPPGNKKEAGKEMGGGKKPYQKPEVKKVLLKPEEAVLGNCKTSGSTGPGFTDCNLSSEYCNTNL